MGCGGTKQLNVESSIQEARDNPLQGLPVLRDALEQRAYAGQEASAKKNVPQVFATLPKTIGGLNWTMSPKADHRRAVIDAGAVIERCVKLVNNPAVGEHSPPAIDAQNLKQCIKYLSAFLKQVQVQADGGESHRLYSMDDEDSSRGARAIAAAIIALFELENHASACRQEVTKCALKVAVSCVKTNSGLTPTAKTALLTMFVALLDEPENTLACVRQHRISSTAQSLINNQILDVLLPYCVDPSEYGVSKEFQLLCAGLLENCIKNGEGIENKAKVEAAIEKAKNLS